MTNATTQGAKDHRTQIPVRLPTDQYEALKAYAFFTKTSMNEVISRAIHDFLTGPGRQEQMDAMLGDVQERYRLALDKLKDL